MNHNPKRRLMLSMVGAAVATAACGGNADPTSAVADAVSNVLAPTTLTVTKLSRETICRVRFPGGGHGGFAMV